jgi:hypothetical protein
MKAYILPIVILFTAYHIGHAQDLDSLKHKILKMDLAINNIHYNMVRSHKEFQVGTLFIITGAALTTIGTLLIIDEPGDLPNNNKNPALLYAGAGMMTIGTVIQINSHKWIGRAGRKR